MFVSREILPLSCLHSLKIFFYTRECQRVLISSYAVSNFTQQSGGFASGFRNVNRVKSYLQRARLINSIRLCLRSGAPESSLLSVLNTPSLDSFVVTNALRSAPSPSAALSLNEVLKKIPHFEHTQHTLYALAKMLAKLGKSNELGELINDINAGKFMNVARVSFMDRMRWYAIAGDLDKVVSVWDDWRRALDKHPCTESYNIVMGLCVQKGKDLGAVTTFRRMIEEGALPNARTYTVVIEHLVKSGKLDSAIEVFRMLPLIRIKRTLKQYSVLVEAFMGMDRIGTVKNLLDEMRIDGILPGIAMQKSLQHMREAGYVEEMEELIREIMPDERIKDVRYSIAGGEDDVDDEDEVIDGSCADNKDEVKLKPWLDPYALASVLKHWGPDEVSALEEAKIVWTSRLVCKMIRSFKSAEKSWMFYCWVAYQPGFTHDVYTTSRMMTKLARDGPAHLVDQLLMKVKREGLKLPFSTIRIIIDSFGFSRNGEHALNIFHNVKTICDPLSKSNQLLLYSSLLRTLAKCKMNTEAIEILEEMILLGILPDIQTFSGLMHHYSLQGDIKTVQRLFAMVRQSGMEPDAYMYKVLILGYCKCERAALAFRIFDDMRNSGLIPDVATKELLVKSLWKEGKLKESAAVQERCEEMTDDLPLALPGHPYTMSNADLMKVYKIYSNSFISTNTAENTVQ